MTDYWHHRYLKTLAKAAESRDAQVRSAYSDLAAHYDAMRRFCERSPIVAECRWAA